MVRVAFDIDEKLNTLFIKHGIDRFDKTNILRIGQHFDCGLCDKNKNPVCEVKIKKLLNEMFEEIPKGAVLAIRGAGRHTAEMLKLLDPDNKEKITCLVDQFGGDGAEELPTFLPDELNGKKIDYFIVSSRFYRWEMKADLKNRGYEDGQIIDPYEYFAEKGLFVGDEFFRDYACADKDAGYSVCWRNVILAKKKYEDALYTENEMFIQPLLYDLILNFLYLRDFVNARKYIDIYINNKYMDYSMFEGLLADLDILFSEIKKRLSVKKNNNILMFLFDSLENDFIEQMSYMKDLRNKSVVFNNSFTQYNYTTSTLQVIFTGRDLIDEKAYATVEFNRENSCLLKNLDDNGYQFHSMSPKKKLFQSFNKTLICAMPRMLWALLQEMLESESKGFYYLHFLETHSPYQCGFSNVLHGGMGDIDRMPIEEQTLLLLKALKYIDGQFAFYNEIIPDGNVKIIMSDHGYNHFSFRGERLNDHKIFELLKTVLFFNGAGYEPRICNDVFCLKNFSGLVSYIINSEDDGALTQMYTRIQSLPTYDESAINFRLERNIKLPLPIRGILTQNDKYTIDYNGQEEYYVLSSDDMLRNRINQPEYSERIDELRRLCGSDFYDIFDQPKFQYAKKAYTEHGYIKG